MRHLKMLLIVVIVIFQIVTLLHAEEGMFPLSEIHKLDLKAAGMELQTDEIFNPKGVSLIDGIIMVGGCTGSFVSLDGLILTNHHCAYRAVQSASTSEHDYLQNGFLARDWTEEIPAKGYTVRITESYTDVSGEVLSVVQEGMTNSERTNAIEKKIKEIVKRAEEENPGKRAEVSEMFIGKSYYLFIYTWLKDVRLVYAPPRSIGEFGGETDNWIWPRHTGDFSFMRAYVAPNGSPAEYSEKNVPYHPRKFLKVAPRGVDEEDFVFILGYPGRTYRHRTSYFLAYEQEVRMPYVEQLYDWEISVMEKMGRDNREVALKHSNRIKGLANVMKNYRGKLKGMKRLNLVGKKRMEEAELQKFIEADALRKEKYDSLYKNIGKIYAEIRRNAQHDLVLDYLRRSVLMFNFAFRVYEASIERAKDDLEREPAYMDRNFQRTKERVFLALKDYYEKTDKILLKEMLMRAVELPAGQKIAAIDEIVTGKKPENAVDEFIAQAYSKTRMAQKEFLEKAFGMSTKALLKLDDPFIQFAEKIYPEYLELREARKRRKGALDELHAKLIDLKQEYQPGEFIPDANRTLRLTYGRIRGYSPADGVYYNPITTLKGVIEKTTGKEPFDTPRKIIDLYRAGDFGMFKSERLNDVPVCILYNMDTTGGNSGSPVLNARGELVGINFDRAFEATINDYAWSEEYSRSIGVDIRYVLWVTRKFGGAEYLLKEMNIIE